MEQIIEVNHLVKRVKDVRAVNDISFGVRKGEFFGLLGPNGAGKTTTIRMLYGFTPPSDGSIRVFDLDITKDWRKIKARIGIGQQDNTLDPDLTVEQNLLIFAGYFYIPSKKAKKRCRELLQFIAPALIAVAIMYNSFFETTYASFVRMYYQKTFDGMLASPYRWKRLS